MFVNLRKVYVVDRWSTGRPSPSVAAKCYEPPGPTVQPARRRTPPAAARAERQPDGGMIDLGGPVVPREVMGARIRVGVVLEIQKTWIPASQ